MTSFATKGRMPMVGQYCVDIKSFEEIALPTLQGIVSNQCFSEWNSRSCALREELTVKLGEVKEVRSVENDYTAFAPIY